MSDKRKLKSVKGIKHKDCTPDEITGGKASEGIVVFYNEYDTEENILVEAEYDNSGEEQSKCISVYEGKNLVGEENYLEGELTEKKTYEYEGGKLKREKTHYLDGSFDTVNHKYAGDVVSEKEKLNSDNEQEGSEKFVYDGKNLIEYSEYDADNVLTRKGTYKYAENSDEIIETTEYSAVDDRELRTVYGTNETVKEGYPDYVIYTKGGSVVQQKNTRFDEGGRLIKQQVDQHHAQGIITYLTVNTYNEKGDLLVAENYTNGTLTQRVERIIDESGQTLMTMVTSSGEGVSTIVYQYVYF